MGDHLDLGTIKHEMKMRDDKIKAFAIERKKLRELLKKAKAAIDQSNLKLKTTKEQMEQKLKDVEVRNQELVQTLEIF